MAEGSKRFKTSASVSSIPAIALSSHSIDLDRLQTDFAEHVSIRFNEPGSEVFKQRSAELSAIHEGFSLVSVVSINNHFCESRFKLREKHIEALNGGAANVITAFHATKASLYDILSEGPDPRTSKGDNFFGSGLYFSTDPLKANDYTAEHGNPHAVRALMRCRVIAGKCKDYAFGTFDRKLLREPAGYHSVSGFCRRAKEHVVYNADQVCVDEVYLYRFTDTMFENTPCFDVPPELVGKVVFITPVLSEFLTKLKILAAKKSTGANANVTLPPILTLRSSLTSFCETRSLQSSLLLR